MGDQVQTATADMWSLGMVALALLSPMTNTELQDMSQMDQVSLRQGIEAVISRRSPPPSDNGLSFVRNCLQISPLERLSTDEAAKHSWLCSPKKHVEFFRKLDEKMMQGFHVQEQFRPIPWEIPQLECVDLDRHNSQSGISMSGCMTTNASPASSCTEEQSHFFNKTYTPKRSSILASEEVPSQLPPDVLKPEVLIDLTPADSLDTRKSTDDERLTNNEDVSIKKKSVQQLSRQRTGSSPKVLDIAFLPLTGLGRHLKQSREKDQRMRVLEELKSTNSKFLSE